MKMQWTLGLAAVVLGAGMLASKPAAAQDATPPPPPPAAGGHAHGDRAGGRGMAALTADLNLTPDQQKTVDAAQADSMTKMKALHEDTTTDPQEKRKQMMQIQKDSMDKVRAVLTDDQKTKFDAKVAEMREQMKAKRGAAAGGGDGAPPAAPPAPPAAQE